MKVREARGLDGWMGWTGARRIPGLGVSPWDFELTMQEPQGCRVRRDGRHALHIFDRHATVPRSSRRCAPSRA